MGWVDFGSVFWYKDKYWFITYAKKHDHEMPFFSDFKKVEHTLYFYLDNRYLDKLSRETLWLKRVKNIKSLTIDDVFWNQIPHWNVPISLEGCVPINIELVLGENLDLNRALYKIKVKKGSFCDLGRPS